MKRLLPDSIAGRTLLVLFVGLSLSHLVSMAIYYSDRAEALTSLGGSQIAERIATISRLVDTSAPAERARIIKAVNGPTLRVTWSQRSLVPETFEADWRVKLTEQILGFYLNGAEADGLRVGYSGSAPVVWPMDAAPAHQASGMRSGPMPVHMQFMMGGMALGRSLRVSLPLSDGTWLNFAAPITAEAPFWSPRFVLSLSVMALTVIMLSVWVVRRLTAPLATFARAAERLGVDVNAPPLPENGSREVRQSARAFNEMQRRIRRFIDDRTHMIAAISHDLRTPLTRMRLRAEFVENTEQQTKMLNDLDEMEVMISSVLSFARDDATAEAQEVVDIVALVESVCNDMADAGQPVEFMGGQRTLLSCRPATLRRALTNLVDNALKYGETARVELIATDEQIVFHIDDRGPGIRQNEHEKVFEPFYRVEQSRSRETGGVGLGLCVARTIVRAHGGDIVLHNLPGGGLRAEVVLPR